MCEEWLLKIGADASMRSKLEALCVALERVHDVVTVCGEACSGGTAELTAVANALRYRAVRPLGLQLAQLSSIIVQLRDGGSPER